MVFQSGRLRTGYHQGKSTRPLIVTKSSCARPTFGSQAIVLKVRPDELPPRRRGCRSHPLPHPRTPTRRAGHHPSHLTHSAVTGRPDEPASPALPRAQLRSVFRISPLGAPQLCPELTGNNWWPPTIKRLQRRYRRPPRRPANMSVPPGVLGPSLDADDSFIDLGGSRVDEFPAWPPSEHQRCDRPLGAGGGRVRRGSGPGGSRRAAARGPARRECG